MSLYFSEKKKLGYIEGFVSVFLNVALFIFKFLVGKKASSVAMMADAWHTLSDTLTSLVVILGFWLAAKPADEEHAFGHGKAESVASVIIGTLLAVVGASFLYESGQRLIHRQGMSFSQMAILVFAVSAVLKEAMAQFSFWAGKKADSEALRADGWHHRSDAIASLLIIVGAVFSQKIWWLDGAMGLAVSLLILKASYDVIRSSASYLIGASPDQRKVDRIAASIQKEFPDLEGIHHLHVHQYGEHNEVTAHLKVPGDMSVEEAHQIASRVEELVKKEFSGDVTIHVEPERHGEKGHD
ncbi:MAG: cation transporter [Candidatus Aminicenantes bacterium]|nr:cation transporter [Candidatus Aminicenantes bacterium]